MPDAENTSQKEKLVEKNKFGSDVYERVFLRRFHENIMMDRNQGVIHLFELKLLN